MLKREQHQSGRDPAAVDSFLDDVAARANRHAVFYLIRPFLADPDDEFIWELALASASDYIVTHNLDDFRDAERFGVRSAGQRHVKSESARLLTRVSTRVDLTYLLWHPGQMKQEELRMLVRNSHQNPFRVHMSDGKSYTIPHPDFGAVAENALLVLSGPGQELGNANFVICYFDQIARVEQLKNKAQTA